MIDRQTLPWEPLNAVECWRYDSSRAMDRISPSRPVEKVWATRNAVYTRNPIEARTTGSRNESPLYATEAEAWDACLAEVRKWMSDRMESLEAMAAEARKATQ